MEIGDGHCTPSQRFVRETRPAVVRGVDAELAVQVREMLLDRGLGNHERSRDLTNRGGLGEEITIE